MSGLLKVVSDSWCAIALLAKYIFGVRLKYQPAVEQYPDTISARMAVDLFPKTKGFLHNDLSKCSGCGDCIKSCSVDAIQMQADQGKDGIITVNEFKIDLGRCYLCSVCVELCPTLSLTHTKEHELASANISGLQKTFLRHFAKNKLELLRENKRIRSYEVRR